MKITFLALLFCFFLDAFGQTNQTNEIVADGHATMKVLPDIACFIITVEKEDDIEKTAIKDLNTEIESLKQSLFKLGFTKEHIKISEYNITRDKYGNDGKKKYTATNVLNVRFKLNNQLIDAFYQQIQVANHKDMDIVFGTELSRTLEKEIKSKLVKTAIDDAKINAENIANALNVKISNVKKVTKYNETVFEDRRFRKSDMVAAASLTREAVVGSNSSFNSFEVDEKELSEEITIVFEISKK